MQLQSLPSGESKVEVQMTLTAPGCGMGPAIAMDAQHRIESLPGVEEADVQVVWDPPWGPEMISAEGKERLGIED
jgi:metal-sulfur cluster biosynthetic enzyme